MDLKDKTILITRAAGQSSELANRLIALGARVLECPTIEIAPPEDWKLVDEAIAKLSSYDWLMFTSANAVEQFMTRAKTCATPIAVVGSATANKLADRGLAAAIVPKDFRAEGLLDAFPPDLKNKRILFPRAERARELLPDELRKRGAQVDVVTVYRTVKAAGAAQLPALLRDNRVDCIAFTSDSTVRYLAESMDGDLSSLQEVAVAVIGPVTRQAAESFGLRPSIEPPRATIPDLVDAIRHALLDVKSR